MYNQTYTVVNFSSYVSFKIMIFNSATHAWILYQKFRPWNLSKNNPILFPIYLRTLYKIYVWYILRMTLKLSVQWRFNFGQFVVVLTSLEQISSF